MSFLQNRFLKCGQNNRSCHPPLGWSLAPQVRTVSLSERPDRSEERVLISHPRMVSMGVAMTARSDLGMVKTL